jgi:hypothetical protein
MTFDVRAWALHDAVFQLARDSGLRSFRVECKLGPEGETIIALILARPALERPALGSQSRADSRGEALAEPRPRDEYAAMGRSARKRPAR